MHHALASRPGSRRLALAVLAFLAGLLIASPSPLLAQYDEQLDVRVIQVPVVVWRGDEPVKGLTKEDFEVLINGSLEPIGYFDVLEFQNEADPAEPAPVRRAQSLQQRRLSLLLFDVANSTYFDLRRARAAVEELVDKASAADTFAVAVYSGAAGIRFLAPFTPDRQAILRAVATLEPSQSGDALALTMTQDERAMSAVMNRVVVPASGTSARIGFDNDLAAGAEDFELTIAAMRGDEESQLPSAKGPLEREQEWGRRSAADDWAFALANTAESISSLEGIKQVVLFTSGSGIHDVSVREFASTAQRLHRRFHRAGVVLNIIDIAGVRAPGDEVSLGASPTSMSIDSTGRDSTPISPGVPEILFTTALGTGGRVIHSAGVSTAVRIFSDTASVTYLLGLRPPAEERANNEIVVRLRNQPVFTNLTYRRGYSLSKKNEDRVSGVMLADAMLNDLPLRDVTVKIDVGREGAVSTTSAANREDGEDGGRVIIDVGIPSVELLAHAMYGLVTVDVFIYVFDESAKVVDWKRRTMTLHEQKVRALLKGAEIVRRERFSLPPGTYSAKALVHVAERDLVGFQRKDFKVQTSAQ